MKKQIFITDKCVRRRRALGSEVMTLSDGTELELVWKSEEEIAAGGYRGEGCYVEEEQ